MGLHSTSLNIRRSHLEELWIYSTSVCHSMSFCHLIWVDDRESNSTWLTVNYELYFLQMVYHFIVVVLPPSDESALPTIWQLAGWWLSLWFSDEPRKNTKQEPTHCGLCLPAFASSTVGIPTSWRWRDERGTIRQRLLCVVEFVGLLLQSNLQAIYPLQFMGISQELQPLAG